MVDYLCDIDGTVADGSHRRHLIKTRPKNWTAYRNLAHLDAPIWPVIRTVLSLGQDVANRIVFCSGRLESEREVTEEWLLKHLDYVPQLEMRPDGDFREDSIIKEEILQRLRAEGFNPIMAFDDRNRVVDMWRRNGVICAQVAPGDF